MSKTYEQCCLEVGLNLKEPPPELETQWVGYDAGNVVPCRCMNDAMKFSLYEKVTKPESRKLHDEYFEIRHMQEEEAKKIFHKSLRDDYPHISDKLFNICYAEAYNQESVHGLDDVAVKLRDVVDFAKMILKLK